VSIAAINNAGSANPSGPLVVKIGGATLEAQAAAPELWASLVALATSHSGGLVLLHGGGKAVDRLMDRLGIKPERQQGLRITPSDQIPEITGVLAGTVNKSLVGCLLRAGGKPVGLCLGDGPLVQARVMQGLDFDPGRVGEVVVREQDGQLARVLLSNGYIPVLSSIGLDERGEPLNLNADDAAAGVAKVLKAAALVLLTDVEGVKGQDGKVIPQLTHAEVERLIATGAITGGMIPKARSSSAVAASGIPVVILSGDRPEHLIRWTKGESVGTRFIR
jgi:acetylglutamate kinase